MHNLPHLRKDEKGPVSNEVFPIPVQQLWLLRFREGNLIFVFYISYIFCIYVSYIICLLHEGWLLIMFKEMNSRFCLSQLCPLASKLCKNQKSWNESTFEVYPPCTFGQNQVNLTCFMSVIMFCLLAVLLHIY